MVGEENLTETCSGKGCKVDMVDIPKERVVVDVDLAYKAHSRTGKNCDRILFYIHSVENSLVTVLIEHKGSTFDSATDIAKQLQGGADFVKEVITLRLKTVCIPVLFHGDGTHKSQHNKLARQQIVIGGNRSPISKEKCNTRKNLARVLTRANALL